MFKNIVFLILSNLILIGCSTMPNNSNNNSTKLIGEINIVINSVQHQYLNNNIISGINLNIKSIETGNIFTINSFENNRLFCINDIKEGIYEIIEIYIEYRLNNKIERIFQEINSRYFIIKKNIINNIGSIVWRFENDYSVVLYVGEHDNIINNYYKKYNIINKDKNESENIYYLITYYRNIQNEERRWNFKINGNDPLRYQELWIFWHLIAGKPVGKYPHPNRNELVNNWVERNKYLLPTTKHIPVVFISTREVEKEKDERVTMDEIKNISVLVNNNTQDPKTSIWFNYIGFDNKRLSTIIINY